MKLGDSHHDALVRLLEVEVEYLKAAGWHLLSGGYWSDGKRMQALSQQDAVLRQRTKDRNDLRSMGVRVDPWV